ncbi:hypothetical protein SLS62_004138 [Diatrype stigma]|uniref:Laccase n=1 Tax=Diatrype stigma TaxID=117547 RepID=A0AAN9V5A4_9PEZI
MGWLKVTIDFVLHVTQLDGFSPLIGYGDVQKPLQPPPIVIDPSPPTYDGCQGTNEEFTPDGVDKVLGKYFNGTYPGPTLQACWGDQLVIHVTNRRSDNGTTVHWHGIRQLNSNEMDGVNGVTQCPISTDDTFTITLPRNSMYPDGVAAPLVIHGPTSEKAWDIDDTVATGINDTDSKQLGPVMISDWVHETAFIVYGIEMQGNGAPPADSIVINGKGHYNNSGTVTGSYFETTFQKGKRHILRLINGSAGASFIFAIDGHDLEVISNDLVAIEPFTVSSLFIGIGQRYTVVVQGKNESEAPGDYWMRTLPADCATFQGSNPPDQRTGIVRYDASSTALPADVAAPLNDTTCADVSTELLNPIVPWCVDQHPQNNVTEDTYEAAVQTAVPTNPDEQLGPPGHPYKHWFLGDRPMWLNFSMPTILNVDASIANPNYTVIEEDYNVGDHPIHLHGSDFVILAQNSTPWDEATSPSTFRYDNPPRRDTAMLPRGGYLALAFRPDNPGSWLLHCHIAWHASSGLALQILVRPRDIPDFLGDLAETVRVCDNWADTPLALSMPRIQDDSGV